MVNVSHVVALGCVVLICVVLRCFPLFVGKSIHIFFSPPEAQKSILLEAVFAHCHNADGRFQLFLTTVC